MGLFSKLVVVQIRQVGGQGATGVKGDSCCGQAEERAGYILLYLLYAEYGIYLIEATTSVNFPHFLKSFRLHANNSTGNSLNPNKITS